jgi:hypothetical protein
VVDADAVQAPSRIGLRTTILFGIYGFWYQSKGGSEIQGTRRIHSSQSLASRNTMRTEKAVVWTVASLIFLAMLHTVVALLYSATGVPSLQKSGLRFLRRDGHRRLEKISGEAGKQFLSFKHSGYAAHGNEQPIDDSTRKIGTSLEAGKSRGRSSASNKFPRSFVVDPAKSVSGHTLTLLTLARLRAHKGPLSHRHRLAQALVSSVGIVGMFAAIVGAMLGLWLDEAGDSDEDGDDGFRYWDVSDSGPHDSAAREEQYLLLRIGECWYGD